MPWIDGGMHHACWDDGLLGRGDSHREQAGPLTIITKPTSPSHSYQPGSPEGVLSAPLPCVLSSGHRGCVQTSGLPKSQQKSRPSIHDHTWSLQPPPLGLWKSGLGIHRRTGHSIREKDTEGRGQDTLTGAQQQPALVIGTFIPIPTPAPLFPGSAFCHLGSWGHAFLPAPLKAVTSIPSQSSPAILFIECWEVLGTILDTRERLQRAWAKRHQDKTKSQGSARGAGVRAERWWLEWAELQTY